MTLLTHAQRMTRLSRRAPAVLFSLATCLAAGAAEPELIGSIERLSPALDAIVPADAKVEKLADGFTWAEGPVWIDSGGYLLFTDVPENTLYRWSPRTGLEVFLKPSGYEGEDLAPLREPGANGLFPDSEDSILLADSGNRVVSRLSLRNRKRTTLAARFSGRRFNSPNDLVRAGNDVIYFTDPPYGLKGLDDSPVKELGFNGVYRIDPHGRVSLVDDSLSFPNGVALSPDEKTLYVANSDPKRPIWMAYDLDAKGEISGKRVFADAADLIGADAPGLPDGLKTSPDGVLFATAPGGVLVMTPAGERLGRIRTGGAIANCAFGEDGRVLYMTSHRMLARVRLAR